MNEINLGKNITKLRRELGITQDELANYIGVSKSSVSKWENNITYPDILLLPQLATLFNVSLDKLMGYEPQLTKESIKKIYYMLADDFTKSNSNEVLDKCEKYVKEYYSCFNFLEQMIILYINHHMLFENKVEILDKALDLCNRIKEDSNNPSLIREVISLEATILIICNRPVEVLELLGEEIKQFTQDGEMIAASYSLLGNINKADEIIEICMYQYLMSLVSDGAQHIMLNGDKLEVIEESAKRLTGICELFNLDKLHPNTTINLYLAIGQCYMMHNEYDKALDMIERYTKVSSENLIPVELRGDEYFDKIHSWLNNLDLGTQAPRSEKFIKESLLNAIKDNQVFMPLKDEKRFKSCILRLESL